MKPASLHNIPASALGYAISFLLLVGLFTSGVLFITATHKRIETHFLGQEYLLFDNYTSLLSGATREESGSYMLKHPSGDTSNIVVKPWGFMRCVVVTTFNGNRSVQREALTAQELDEVLPCFYLPDNKSKIALAGKTKLEGIVMVPERSLKRANIAGKPYSGDALFYGTLKQSERFLPPLKDDILENNLSYLFENASVLTTIPADSNFSFKYTTSLIRTNEALEISQHLEGNLVVQSFERITVHPEARLKNIILLAPEIIFEKEFRGSVQAIASRQIICEERVRLDYPSSLMLFEDKPFNNEQSRITLLEGSQILGGVLLVSKNPDFRNPVLLDLQEATIGGLVYNQGESEIRGEIIGSLYTNKLIAHAGGGSYGGHLVDAIISSKELPKEFILPNWFRESKVSQPTIVSWL